MQRNRLFLIASGVVLVLLLSAFGYDQAKNNTVPAGVTAGGVDLSGLSKSAAEKKLDSQLQQPLLKPVKVSYEGRTRSLTAGGAGVNVDVNGMVQEALNRGNKGFFLVNAAKSVLGKKRDVSVSTSVNYSQKAVDNFVANTQKAFDRPAVDASIHYAATSLGEVDGHPGISVKAKRLTREIVAKFNDASASRKIKAPVKVKEPKVTRSQLAGKYPTIVLVDREGFKLRLFKKLKMVKSYKIAVGMAGLETPQGLYSITDKQYHPVWHVPNSAWAGKLAGKTIGANDPANPIKARWLGIYDGVGIHGTDELGSIGSAASHGCIRMVPSDVIDLYPRVPLGSPVYIG